MEKGDGGEVGGGGGLRGGVARAAKGKSLH